MHSTDALISAASWNGKRILFNSELSLFWVMALFSPLFGWTMAHSWAPGRIAQAAHSLSGKSDQVSLCVVEITRSFLLGEVGLRRHTTVIGEPALQRRSRVEFLYRIV